jgi:hypothetical protein
MALEGKLYLFIKGLKTNIQMSVAMQDPKTVQQDKILASSADGILSHQRSSLPSPVCQSWFAFRRTSRSDGNQRSHPTSTQAGPRRVQKAPFWATILRLWEGWALRLRARGRRFSSRGELGQPHPNRSYGSRRDSWREGARTEADEEGGYRSPEKTNQIPMPALQSSVLSKRFSLP